MLPFGLQGGFAGDQARSVGCFCQERTGSNFIAKVGSLAEAREYIVQTQAVLGAAAGDDGKLTESKRVNLGTELYCELFG